MRYEDKDIIYKRILEDKPNAPTVLFAPEAIAAMHHIVSKCGEEVGWFGTVEYENGIYRVDNITIPGQEVNAGTCELTNDGLASLCTDIMDAGGDPTKVKFWGHSHHNMGVSPSGQDEKQVRELLEASNDFFIRAICNKQGLMSVSVYNKLENVIFDNVRWNIDFNVDLKGVATKYDKLIDDNVKEFTHTTHYQNHGTVKKPKSFMKNLTKFKPSKLRIKQWK